MYASIFCRRMKKRVVSLALRRRLHSISDAVTGLLRNGCRKSFGVSRVDLSTVRVLRLQMPLTQPSILESLRHAILGTSHSVLFFL